MEKNKQFEIATFAAGCFWGVEEIFYKTPGVIKTTVGYTGGHTKNPTYENVCTDTTGHAEAVELQFDPTIISYEKLLKIFWESHDYTTKNRQGPDIGSQYRSAIFYHSPEQKKLAETSKPTKAVTEIVAAGEFWRAEEYHQQYFLKNPGAVCHI